MFVNFWGNINSCMIGVNPYMVGAVNPFMAYYANPYMMRFNFIQSMIGNMLRGFSNQGCNCQNYTVQQFPQIANYTAVQSPYNDISVFLQPIGSRTNYTNNNALAQFNNAYSECMDYIANYGKTQNSSAYNFGTVLTESRINSQTKSGNTSLSKNERIELLKEHLKNVEGGYACVEGDKGGATKHGVTHGTYDDYRRRKNLPLRSVQEMTDDEFSEIIENFWQKSGADKIENPILAFYVFSTDWGSGIGKSKQFLAQCGNDPEKFEQLRRDFYNRIAVGSNAKFKKGWQNRVTRDHNFAYSKLV